MLIPHRKQRLLVGAAFAFGKKSGKFFVAGQFGLPGMMMDEY
jgi:hypothetical protein